MFPAQTYAKRKAALGPGRRPLPLHGRHRREPQGGEGGVRRGAAWSGLVRELSASPAREIMEQRFRGRLRLQRLHRGRRRHDPGRRQAEPMSAGRGGRP
ncbi:MAG: hypothetical protein M0C28_21195 [Candidatus Moduliflexus flocculans]|nr:hypothetical protein [Candidatus Moduliflexus flocculans]